MRSVSALTEARRLLDSETLRRLGRRSDAKGALRLGIHLGLIAGSSTLIALAQGSWWLLPAMLLQGWLLVALFAVVHECVHYTAFRSTRANVIAAWLAGLPTLLNADYYRLFHYAHHRHPQDPVRDPELNPPPPQNLQRYVTRIVGWQYWQARLGAAFLIARGDFTGLWFIHAAQRRQVMWSMRAMLGMAAIGLVVPLALGSLAPLTYWIVPVLLGQPILRAILVTEHTGCSMDDNPLTNTRTTLAGWPVRLVHWNMPFHCEHHLYPSIPFHALPAAHRLLGARFRHVEPSYLAGNRAIVAGIRSAA